MLKSRQLCCGIAKITIFFQKNARCRDRSCLGTALLSDAKRSKCQTGGRRDDSVWKKSFSLAVLGLVSQVWRLSDWRPRNGISRSGSFGHERRTTSVSLVPVADGQRGTPGMTPFQAVSQPFPDWFSGTSPIRSTPAAPAYFISR